MTGRKKSAASPAKRLPASKKAKFEIAKPGAISSPTYSPAAQLLQAGFKLPHLSLEHSDLSPWDVIVLTAKEMGLSLSASPRSPTYEFGDRVAPGASAPVVEETPLDVYSLVCRAFEDVLAVPCSAAIGASSAPLPPSAENGVILLQLSSNTEFCSHTVPDLLRFFEIPHSGDISHATVAALVARLVDTGLLERVSFWMERVKLCTDPIAPLRALFKSIQSESKEPVLASSLASHPHFLSIAIPALKLGTAESASHAVSLAVGSHVLKYTDASNLRVDLCDSQPSQPSSTSTSSPISEFPSLSAFTPCPFPTLTALPTSEMPTSAATPSSTPLIADDSDWKPPEMEPDDDDIEVFLKPSSPASSPPALRSCLRRSGRESTRRVQFHPSTEFTRTKQVQAALTYPMAERDRVRLCDVVRQLIEAHPLCGKLFADDADYIINRSVEKVWPDWMQFRAVERNTQTPDIGYYFTCKKHDSLNRLVDAYVNKIAAGVLVR